MANTEPLLERAEGVQPPTGPLVLLIMDGVGKGLQDEYDAVWTARTPNLDRLSAEGIERSIFAHGPYVGLQSKSDMGNSEVGHNTMGAGRILDQGAKRIEVALEHGSIWTGAWPRLVENVKEHDGALHLIGLLSDGNIHASTDHLFALLDRAVADGVRTIFVHGLHDGRDVPDRTADKYVAEVEDRLAKLREESGATLEIASGGGRMVTTMDRYEANWGVVERGWEAHVLGTARPVASALEAIEATRAENPSVSDQLIPAFTVVRDGKPIGPIVDGDSVVLFNFRGDRAIELARAFTEGDDFAGFDRKRVPEVFFAGLTLYDGDTNMPEVRLVEPEEVVGTVSERLASVGVRQFACAETQKFGHVTYFWNGNRSDAFDPSTETYDEIPSDQVPFDQRPWMKSAQTADMVIDATTSGSYDFIRANFAGGDMVGHTGDFEAAVIAVEAVDLAVGRVAAAVEKARGCLVVTADHGNAEDMVERTKDGQPEMRADGSPRWRTAHSVNPIPLIVRDYSGHSHEWRDDQPEGGLANLASTLVHLLGYRPPEEFDPSLLKS